MNELWLERWGSRFSGPRSRWITLLVWVVLIGVLSGMWPQVNSQTVGNPELFTKDYPSVIAEEVQKREFPDNNGITGIIVLYRASGFTADDYTQMYELNKSLADQPLQAQASVAPLYQLPANKWGNLASKDNSALLMPIFFEKDAGIDNLKKAREQLFERVEKVFNGAQPQKTKADDQSNLMLRFTGPVGIQIDATDLFLKADVTLLIATFILVLVLLLLIYRSPILAILPLIGVGFAYGVISPVLGFMAQQGWIVVDSQATAIMSVLLFGAGTDYCLFLIARYRELLKTETNKFRALVMSFSGTSGAITMSGLTVVISLLTLLLADQGNIQRFAVPFAVAILVMVAASLTVIPALLSILGRASFWPFVPRTEEMLRARAEQKNKPFVAPKEGGRFGKWNGNIVVRRPWTIVLITVLVLGVLAAFVPQIKYTNDILSSFPKDMASREGFDIIGKQFTKGDLAPVTVMADTEGKKVEIYDAILQREYVAALSEPQYGKVNPEIIKLTFEFKGNPYDAEVIQQIADMRQTVEQTMREAGIGNASEKVWISGQSATQYDQQQANARDVKLIVPIVIALIAALLLIYLRSIVATIYLMLTVILSYFSALGLGWLIIHYGMGAEAISATIPLYAFVFIVALGEDYNIFMVSGIWKKRRQLPLNDAISQGVSETGSVITSAGLILAGTFAVLASLPIQVLVHFGIITAIGVLLDTFLVRPFLVPAITALLGKRAFWPSK